MIKIDLITGFLGSGKTTFIKKYAQYLISKGLKVGILENDYGAVNVDMMLLQELENLGCGLEMVAGACDADCHRRRFKTKLIALGMSGYDRVLVEPSGIFDVDEFFDALYEEPLSRWYEIGNVIAIVDASLEEELSDTSEYLLASQIADAGAVLLSRTQETDMESQEATIRHMNRALERFQCKRKIDNVVVNKDWNQFTPQDFENLLRCSYVAEDFVKAFSEEHDFKAVYLMNLPMTEKKLLEIIPDLLQDASCGKIFRVKGFFQESSGLWKEINVTKNNTHIQQIPKGQEIIIVIGEDLKEEQIKRKFAVENA